MLNQVFPLKHVNVKALTLWQHWDFSEFQSGCPEDGNLRERHLVSQEFMRLVLEERDGHQISLATLSNSTGLGATKNKQKDKDLFLYPERHS